MTASKCAICMSWLRPEEGGRGKRKRPHIDQYEEGIAQGAIDESQQGKMVDLRFYADSTCEQ
jgi:hypothetical protein